MKTHQEIRDAIDSFEKAVYSAEATPIVLNILHALNDRLEELERHRANCDAALLERIAKLEFTPPIT